MRLEAPEKFVLDTTEQPLSERQDSGIMKRTPEILQTEHTEFFQILPGQSAWLA